MSTKIVLIILNLVALLVSIIWFLQKFDFEPAISSIGLTATLIGLIFVKENVFNNITMNQKSGRDSKSIKIGNNNKGNNIFQ